MCAGHWDRDDGIGIEVDSVVRGLVMKIDL